MVLSIDELRRICQRPVQPFDFYPQSLIYRKMSIYITKLFLYTTISANQVTIMSLILGLFASFLFSFGHYFIGACVFLLCIFLDYVDGEVARYRKTSSVRGVYLDIMTHYIVDPFVFVGLSIGVYRILGDSTVLIYGAVSSICIILTRITRDANLIAPLQIKTKNNSYGGPKKVPSFSVNLLTNKLIYTNLKSFIPYIIDNIIYVIILFAIICFFLPEMNLTIMLKYLLTFYGLTFPFVCLIWIIHIYNEL